MNFMLAFLVLCVLLGLWSPPKAKRSWIVVVLAVIMVAFFYVSSSHM